MGHHHGRKRLRLHHHKVVASPGMACGQGHYHLAAQAGGQSQVSAHKPHYPMGQHQALGIAQYIFIPGVADGQLHQQVGLNVVGFEEFYRRL